MLMVGWHGVINGDADRASEWIDKGLALTETRGDTVMRTHVMATAALCRWQQGNVDGAREGVEEALRLARSINDSWSGAQFLEISAWITAIADPQRAAVLMGAAATISRTCGASSLTTTTMGPFHDQAEQRIRTLLGSAEFDAAYAEGSALTVHQAIALALDEERSAIDPLAPNTQ
jgi:hypothetical protein